MNAVTNLEQYRSERIEQLRKQINRNYGETLKVEELQDVLQVSRSTISRLTADAKIGHYKYDSRTIRFSDLHVATYLVDSEVVPYV
jgi:excisionase family DNA binding protein